MELNNLTKVTKLYFDKDFDKEGAFFSKNLTF